METPQMTGKTTIFIQPVLFGSPVQVRLNKAIVISKGRHQHIEF
jgi:hypothetical protein